MPWSRGEEGAAVSRVALGGGLGTATSGIGRGRGGGHTGSEPGESLQLWEKLPRPGQVQRLRGDLHMQEALQGGHTVRERLGSVVGSRWERGGSGADLILPLSFVKEHLRTQASA